MKIASLDLGSNTFLCLVSEVVHQKIVQIYSDDIEIVRLGQGVSETKRLHPDALLRARKALEKFRKTLDHHKPSAVLAMATSAARDAENKSELFQICADLNIPLEIIPGDQEAKITYQGSISGLSVDNHRQLVLDIGGGSTEFIIGEKGCIDFAQSLDIGCVRLTEKFISTQPTSEKEILALQDEVRKQIGTFASNNKTPIQDILAVAGTPTTLAAVELGYFDAQKIDGYSLLKSNLENWLNRLTHLSIEEKVKIGFPTGRADVILVGVVILLETLRCFGLDQLSVSTRGVRYGIALEVARRFKS